MFATTFDHPAIEIIKGKQANIMFYEVILDKLYWISAQRPPQSDYNAYFFNIDNVSTFLQIPFFPLANDSFHTSGACL